MLKVTLKLYNTVYLKLWMKSIIHFTRTAVRSIIYFVTYFYWNLKSISLKYIRFCCTCFVGFCMKFISTFIYLFLLANKFCKMYFFYSIFVRIFTTFFTRFLFVYSLYNSLLDIVFCLVANKFFDSFQLYSLLIINTKIHLFNILIFLCTVLN